MTKWFKSNQYVNLIKYITDCQEHTNNDTDKFKFKKS